MPIPVAAVAVWGASTTATFAGVVASYGIVGGVIAGAVVGAVAGGATAAIMGQDIGKGALAGALVGAAGGGIAAYSSGASLLSGAEAAAGAAPTPATSAMSEAQQAGLMSQEGAGAPAAGLEQGAGGVGANVPAAQGAAQPQSVLEKLIAQNTEASKAAAEATKAAASAEKWRPIVEGGVGLAKGYMTPTAQEEAEARAAAELDSWKQRLAATKYTGLGGRIGQKPTVVIPSYAQRTGLIG